MPTLQTYNGYPLWHYIPNLPAAIAFEALFGVVTVLHIYLLVRKRMWFCLPFVLGGIFEVVGYQGRALAYNKTGELIPYILQSIFSLLAPILFAATLYMTLGGTIRAVHGEQYLIISPRWLTRIFVLGDIFSFLIQASGAGILVKNGTGNGNNDTQLGNYIIVGGLIFQIIIFGVFLLAVFMFNVRFAKHKGKNQRRHSEATRGASWQGMLYMLYVTSSCILIRNIFRTVQYIMGQGGYLLAHEWAVYVFDGALMLLTMVCFLIRYPSHLDRMEDEDYGTELGGRDEGSRV